MPERLGCMVTALSSRTLARSQSSDGFTVLRAGWCDSRDHLLLGVRRELGVVFALSSYKDVHGNFNRETLEVSERGLRGSARGAKLEEQKNERGDKKLEVSVSSAPEPRRPHHEGAFQGRVNLLTERGPVGRSRGSR